MYIGLVPVDVTYAAKPSALWIEVEFRPQKAQRLRIVPCVVANEVADLVLQQRQAILCGSQVEREIDLRYRGS